MSTVLDKKAFFAAIGYVPHSLAQWEYHRSTARFKLPVCGRRFGKSTMAMRDRELYYLVPEKTLDWVVGPTYELGEKEFRVMWDDLLVKKQLARDKRVRRAYNKRTGEMYVDFPWGPRIEVRSAGHPETLVGDALHHVIMSEAAKHSSDTWHRFISPALSDHRGGADFPTTPEGQNWLYLLWQFGQDPQYRDVYQSWNFPSWLNTALFPLGEADPEIQLLRQTMSSEAFDQEIAAKFSAFVGKIYNEFDENVHVKPCVFHPEWPNYIAFDWGFTSPLAAIEFQIDPWGKVYVWREHYQAFTVLEEHLRIMQEREQPEGYHINCCWGDAADPEATLRVNTHFAPCISLPEAKSNWRQGVNLVKRYLKLYQIGEDAWERPIEEPLLYIDHSCKNLIREFNNYRRRDTKLNIIEHGAASAAQKQDDHALDALRYGFMHVFELGAQHHLSDTVATSPDDVTDLLSGDESDTFFQEGVLL